MLRRDAECVNVCALGRDAELEAAVRLDPARHLLRRRPRHPAAQADRLYPLLHEDVEALEDVVAVREALGGLEATLK